MEIKYKNNKTIIENYELYTLPSKDLNYINPEHYCIIYMGINNINELFGFEMQNKKYLDYFADISLSNNKIMIEGRKYNLIEMSEHNKKFDKFKLKEING
jgi:hypothetical protein